MKKVALLSLLAIAFLLSAFSLADEPNTILGRWEYTQIFKGSPFSFLIIFRANGNYDGFANKKIFVSGTYKMQHDTLYISDPICNSSYQGTYKVHFFRQDSIKFQIIRDTCLGRKEGVDNLVYKKVKAVAK